MKIIDKLEKQAKNLAEIIVFEVEYIPGLTIEDDMFKAVQIDLNITTYGSTESQAIISARKEAVGRIMEDSSLRASLSSVFEKRQRMKNHLKNNNLQKK